MSSVEFKRRRIDNGTATKSSTTHSRIFAPYRSLGHVTSSIPFTLLPQGRTFQLTTALDNTVQTYDIRKLNLLFVSSPPTPGLIQRIVAYRDVVYVAFDDALIGLGVWVFKRGRKIVELQLPTGKWVGWKDLVVFGDWIIGAFDSGLLVWKRETGEIWTEIEMGGASGAVMAVVHPSAVLNKVCVARRNGDVEIWNIKTSKRIYTILSPLPQSTKGTAPGITVLVQTPAVSVVAIGYSTGEVHLHNIITDTPLFTLNATTSGQRVTAAHQRRVSSLSFCTDPTVGSEKKSDTGGARMMAVGDDDGHVTLWNLKKRAVAAVMWNTHAESSQGVNVEWLAGQNVLVTSGADNSIKEWVFDSPQTLLPRILRSRAGHSQAISALEFASPTSHFVLSASTDRSLRAQSLRNDAQSFEFSQGKEVKKATKAAKYDNMKSIEEAKAGPIICIAAVPGDGREWESILTGHQGERAARCWSFRNKKMGRWLLESKDGGQVKAVAISCCGTFGFVGSSTGGVDMYNLQSGMHRRGFPCPLTPAQARKVKNGEAVGRLAMAGKGKHTKAVTGIATDSLNRVVITSALDGRIKFWEFTTGILVHEISLGGGAVTKMRLHRPNELLAVSCDDLCIRVIDIETKKVVRELWGCGGNITDFTFSDDGRWVVAAAMDSIVRVWDLPTGHLIDGMRTKSIITALAFSGDAEFLATTHVDSVGINLWTNRTLFRPVPTRLITEEDIVDLTMPTVAGGGGTNAIEGAISTDKEEDIMTDGTIYNTVEQLSEKMLTMSLVPRTRWQTLLNLEVVRQRNKPKEAPKQPEKAPFFLPSVGMASLTPKEDEDMGLTPLDRSRIRKMDASNNESVFSQCLREKDYLGVVETLKNLSPAAADLEIRSLEPEEMVTFVEALTLRLKTRRDFELVQTWMAVFLRVHGEVVVSDSESATRLRKVLEEWRGEQKREAGRLSERVGYCRGLAVFLRSGR